MCSFVWKRFYNIIFFSEPQFFCRCRLWIKQCLSLVNPAIMTKLQLIRIKTELVYTSRWRTTSLKNDAWVNKNCKYNTFNNGGNSNTKRVSLFGPTCIFTNWNCSPYSDVWTLGFRLSGYWNRVYFWVYTLWVKKGTSILLPATLADVDGFSKFFHCWIHQEICNKLTVTLPTTP